MKISVIAVDFHALEFRNLLAHSVGSKAKDKECFEICVHDNGGNNIGHGPALNKIIKEQAQGEYILVLDIDTHILAEDWDEKLLNFCEKSGADLIAAQGGLLKPARPCVMFFKRQWFLDNGFNFEARQTIDLKFDVGVYFYHLAVHKGFKVEFFKYATTEYKEVWGNEFTLAGERFAYHNFYGTRFYSESKQEVDGRKREDFLKAKKNLFDQYYKDKE